MCSKVDFVDFNDNLYGVIFTPRFYGCREEDGVANEKDRHIDSMMKKHPDWDWDYWVAQIARRDVS